MVFLRVFYSVFTIQSKPTNWPNYINCWYINAENSIRGGFKEDCNKFLNIEQIERNKSIYALRMITSDIVFHSFLKYTPIKLSSHLCTSKDWQNQVRKTQPCIIRNRMFLTVYFRQIAILMIQLFLHSKQLHRWVWAFGSYIDLRIRHRHFLRGLNLRFSAIVMLFSLKCSAFSPKLSTENRFQIRKVVNKMQILCMGCAWEWSLANYV